MTKAQIVHKDGNPRNNDLDNLSVKTSTRVVITARSHPHWSEVGTLTGEKLGTGQVVVHLNHGTNCGVMPGEFRRL